MVAILWVNPTQRPSENFSDGLNFESSGLANVGHRVFLMHKRGCVYAVAGLFHVAADVADFDAAADLNNTAGAVGVFAVDVPGCGGDGFHVVSFL